MTITNQEYWNEVESSADYVISQAIESLAYDDNLTLDTDTDDVMEIINDHVLHEYVDSHQWVIYYSYNLDVIQHSGNADYYADNFGSDSLMESLKQGGLSGLHNAIAYFAFYADILDNIDQDAIEDALLLAKTNIKEDMEEEE